MCLLTQKLSELCSSGIFMEASSRTRDGLLTPAPLPFLEDGEETESSKLLLGLLFVVPSPHLGAHQELLH